MTVAKQTRALKRIFLKSIVFLNTRRIFYIVFVLLLGSLSCFALGHQDSELGMTFEDNTSGIFKLTEKTKNGARVDIEMRKIKYPDDFAFSRYVFFDDGNLREHSFWPKFYLISMSVKVKGRQIDIYPSFRQGIFDPNYVKFESSNGDNFIITIRCRDASEAYRVVLYFNKNSIEKKEIYLGCDKPEETIIYNYCE